MNIRQCALALTLAIPLALSAAQVTHPIGLQVWYPDDWARQINQNKLMVKSFDSKAIMLFKVIDAADIPAATQKLDTELEAMMTDKMIEKKPKPVTLNGLKGIIAEGSGTIKGVPSLWLAGIFVHNKHALMLLGFAEKSSFDLHKENLKKIVQSIKPQ